MLAISQCSANAFFVILLLNDKIPKVSPDECQQRPGIPLCLQPASVERATLVFDESDVAGLNARVEERLFERRNEICPRNLLTSHGDDPALSTIRRHGDAIRATVHGGEADDCLEDCFHYNASKGRAVLCFMQ